MAVLRMETVGKEGTLALTSVCREVSKVAVQRDFSGLGDGSVREDSAAQHKDLCSTPGAHAKTVCDDTCLESRP